jgi:antitoxin PrlF
MNAIVSEKGQVTIPKALRDELGLDTGTVLEFHEENGRLVAQKQIQENPITAWRGRAKLPLGRNVDDYLAHIRGKK